MAALQASAHPSSIASLPDNLLIIRQRDSLTINFLKDLSAFHGCSDVRFRFCCIRPVYSVQTRALANFTCPGRRRQDMALDGAEAGPSIGAQQIPQS